MGGFCCKKPDEVLDMDGPKNTNEEIEQIDEEPKDVKKEELNKEPKDGKNKEQKEEQNEQQKEEEQNDEPKEEQNDEPKEEQNDEPKEETKDEPKEEQQDEPKEEQQDEVLNKENEEFEPVQEIEEGKGKKNPVEQSNQIISEEPVDVVKNEVPISFNQIYEQNIDNEYNYQNQEEVIVDTLENQVENSQTQQILDSNIDKIFDPNNIATSTEVISKDINKYFNNVDNVNNYNEVTISTSPIEWSLGQNYIDNYVEENIIKNTGTFNAQVNNETYELPLNKSNSQQISERKIPIKTTPLYKSTAQNYYNNNFGYFQEKPIITSVSYVQPKLITNSKFTFAEFNEFNTTDKNTKPEISYIDPMTSYNINSSYQAPQYY